MSKINKPEFLKFAGFALIVGAALFAPTHIRIADLVGAAAIAVGYGWSRLEA